MDAHIEQIREQQEESWNKFSPGWKKWDHVFMDFLKPMGDEIISLLNPKGEEVVLDVASGTGEPGLTIAAMLENGSVISTDLAEGMLSIARENAIKRGIKNFKTERCDVSVLPFGDHTFDAVSCRLGFMFFPDMFLAAKEMVRVLKPGGRLATSVWGAPEKNFWITAILDIINKNMQLPPLPPDAPGMFRCSKPGLIAGLLSQAGLENVSEREITGKLYSGTAEIYWTIMTDVAAPVASSLSKADEATRKKIKNEVFELLDKKYPDGKVLMDSSALVIHGEKLTHLLT